MARLLIILFATILLGGCQMLGPDDDSSKTDRTYPEAFGYPDAILHDLLDGNHPAGSYDLTAFVVGISECPPDFVCLVADHILVAGSPHTDSPALMIGAEKPSQFELDEDFVLSIEVFTEAFPESNQVQYVRLVGYSEVN
ncbi:MAG: hypothetical protein ACPG3U_00400 [Rhodothermales bacterium]